MTKPEEPNNDAQIFVRTTSGTANALDRVAEKYGVKRTRLIREMLTQCLHAIGEPIIEPDKETVAAKKIRWESLKKNLTRDLQATARRNHV